MLNRIRPPTHEKLQAPEDWDPRTRLVGVTGHNYLLPKGTAMVPIAVAAAAKAAGWTTPPPPAPAPEPAAPPQEDE